MSIKRTVLGKAGVFSEGCNVSLLGYHERMVRGEIAILYSVSEEADIAVKLPLLKQQLDMNTVIH